MKILKDSTYYTLLNSLDKVREDNIQLNILNIQKDERIAELEPKSAKADKEAARCREKYHRLYKGKERVKIETEQPYTIEGKTVKQLVEENLGIKVKSNNGEFGYLCGYEVGATIKQYGCFVIGIKSNDGFKEDTTNYLFIRLVEYKSYLWADPKDVISAIKKHRNIK